MQTAQPAAMIATLRRLPSAVLLLVAGCGVIHLPPPEGRSLEERRRTLDEIPSASAKAAESAPAGEAAANAAATSPGDAAPDGAKAAETGTATTPRSMSEAKALDDPELGIRLPLGIPTLKAGRGNRD